MKDGERLLHGRDVAALSQQLLELGQLVLERLLGRQRAVDRLWAARLFLQAPVPEGGAAILWTGDSLGDSIAIALRYKIPSVTEIRRPGRIHYHSAGCGAGQRGALKWNSGCTQLLRT